MHNLEEDGGLNHVLDAALSFFKQDGEVLQSPLGLSLDVLGNQF